MPGKLIIRWQPLVLGGIVVLGLVLRLYGLNWDQGYSFHPDERQILFRVTALHWPANLAEFRDPNSPLNPHFFAYGSFPLYLLAFVGNILGHFRPEFASFTQLTLVGRVLSALFDSFTIALSGWLALLLVKDEQLGRPFAWSVALLTAALVAFTPLQIQLSHFYAVDTLLLCFVMLMLVACVKLVGTPRPLLWSFIAGLAYGLAMATKFSAVPLVVPLIIALGYRWYVQRETFSAILTLCSTILFAVLVFFLTQPYALLDMSTFIQQVSEQGSMARGGLDYPYVRQFAGTIPFVYQAQNMLLWGMGVTLGLAAFAGILWVCWLAWKHRAGLWLIPCSWVFIYGLITGSFYVKFMRYMLPIYPCLALLAAAAVLTLARYPWKIEQRAHAWPHRVVAVLRTALPLLVLAGTIFQGMALLNVYSQPNTRIQASRWIYSHLPKGSVLTYEQWDDALPIQIDGQDPSQFLQASYADAQGNPATGLDLYGDDTPAKAKQLAQLLTTVNAITMPTERLKGSIPRLPARYPLTIRYYQLLFSGQLGFHLAAQFEVHPSFLGITLNDSGADESFTVFDHPTARIFVRNAPYPYSAEQLEAKLLEGVRFPTASGG